MVVAGIAVLHGAVPIPILGSHVIKVAIIIQQSAKRVRSRCPALLLLEYIVAGCAACDATGMMLVPALSTHTRPQRVCSSQRGSLRSACSHTSSGTFPADTWCSWAGPWRPGSTAPGSRSTASSRQSSSAPGRTLSTSSGQYWRGWAGGIRQASTPRRLFGQVCHSSRRDRQCISCYQANCLVQAQCLCWERSSQGGIPGSWTGCCWAEISLRCKTGNIQAGRHLVSCLVLGTCPGMPCTGRCNSRLR
jgi:hypothetical protein